MELRLMADLHPTRRFGSALSLLTVLPGGGGAPRSDPGVAAWFPLVGAVFGLVGYAIVKVAAELRIQMRAPFLVAVLIVVAWAMLSRLLHWDGLADVADGFWGAHDRERRLEIMADSQTGAFGSTAIALVAILEVIAIGVIVGQPHELVVLLVPVISRFSATAAAWLGTPARPGGLGHSIMGHPSTASVIVAVVPLSLVLSGLWVGYEALGVAAGVLGIVVAFAIPHVLASRFGGVTGDVMGASVLLTEVTIFTVMALAMSVW
jgi:adenosylcobinamide-GDP ribazoletransferase